MNDRTITRRTCLFVVFLLLAGVANLVSRIRNPVLSALLTSCNYLILNGNQLPKWAVRPMTGQLCMFYNVVGRDCPLGR